MHSQNESGDMLEEGATADVVRSTRIQREEGRQAANRQRILTALLTLGLLKAFGVGIALARGLGRKEGCTIADTP